MSETAEQMLARLMEERERLHAQSRAGDALDDAIRSLTHAAGWLDEGKLSSLGAEARALWAKASELRSYLP